MLQFVFKFCSLRFQQARRSLLIRFKITFLLGSIMNLLKKREKTHSNLTGESGRLSAHSSFIWSVVSEGLAKSCYKFGGDQKKRKGKQHKRGFVSYMGLDSWQREGRQHMYTEETSLSFL